VLAAGLATPATALAADPPLPAGAQDEILVRYRENTSPAQRRAVARDLDLAVVQSSKNGRTAVVKGKGVSPATVRRLLNDDPRVAAIGMNHRREIAADPTQEPGFRYEWGLHNTGQTIQVDAEEPPVTGVADIDIDGLEAIRVQRGKPEIVVAVIDDGVDFEHPDLADRAWTNPGETPDNNVDDDGNGFVDDVNGWDFCHDDATVHDAGHDGHGTHVAGTIAASLDGSGVVGVAPGIRIMALKFLDDVQNCGQDAQAIDAIDYAASFGVPIINASWGGTGQDDVLDEAIIDSGALLVAASGNAGLDLDRPKVDFYPAETNAANVLTVGAIDQIGDLAEFTNYGATAVDLVAPGTNVLSTYPPQSGCPSPCFAWSDGTSMAAPHVTGVAALALSSATSPMSATALRAHVLSRAIPLAQASCFSSTGRIVNAYRAVTSAGPTAMPPCTWRFDVGSIIGTGISSTLSWQPATGNLTGVKYVVWRRRDGSAWSTIATQTGRSVRQTLGFGAAYKYATRTRTSSGSLGPVAYGQYVEAGLYQESTSAARYSGRWLTATSSTYSGGRTRMSTQNGAYVEFRRSAMAIAVVGRRGPTSGKARIYVDGVLATTIDLYRSSVRSRTVLFSKSWTTVAPHTVRVVVLGTSGRPRVDIDGFAILR
jgi:subtilisin family serine protease